MKKILCVLISLLLTASFSAASANESVWTFDYDDYKITEYHGDGGDVTIPEAIDDCTVDVLGMSLFNGDETITSLALPSTLIQVEENVISFCDNLTELIIPEGVQVIEDNSFVCNPSLTEVVIPASVRYIGKSCFGSSENLKKVTFLGECPVFAGNALDWIADDAEVYVPDDQYDAYAEALYNAECYSVILPSGSNALVYDFSADPSLFEFDASTGTILYYNGFDAVVEIPSEIDGIPVKAIGDQAFAENRYLSVLTLPEEIETIGESAFESCRTLLHIDFPSTLKTVGDRAFYSGYKGYALELPSVETIGDEAFALCIRISDPIDLPEGLVGIGDSAFESCSWLSEVYIPESVETIGAKAFADSAINYLAFEGRTLPVMAENTLENCWYLADIDIHSKASKQEMLDMQAMVDGMGLSCRVWRMQNPDVDYINDGLDVYEEGVLVAYTGEQTHIRPWDTYDEYTVTAIGPAVFKDNQIIEYFSVPYSDEFTVIGAEAFAGSSVKYIDLFDSVTTIGDGAFRDCVNIEELIIPESVTSIGAEVLSGCVNIKELVVPDSVTEAGSGMLKNCSGLEKLTVLCDPFILPADFMEGCNARIEIYAAETATDEQLKYLSNIAGRAWNNPVTRIGETAGAVQAMPFDSLPAEDFWYDSEYSRLDRYQGYELNLVLPREIDGVQLTMLGGDVMGRAVSYDGEEAELPIVSVVIPETYTEIVPYAFADCADLETVICYAPIELLPDSVFRNCTNLREVIFVNGVHSIGNYVFDNCANLQTVYIGNYTENVGEYAFTDINGEPLWSLDKCITDPEQLPDVAGLLENVKADPMPVPEPEAAPEPAVPVGAEGEPYFGIWNGIEMVMDGSSLNLADFDMTMTLILLADGRMVFTDEPVDISDLSIPDDFEAPGWRVENGIAIGDGCTMTILEDGRLELDDNGSKLYFEFSGNVSEDAEAPSVQDSNNTAAVAPAPEVSVQTGSCEVKYVCINADVEGYTLDASMLGGEYSLIFHENGTADFVVVGAAMPSLPWEKLETGNFMIDYFGTKMEIVWTDAGFDMNYFDTMLMHFVPQN